MFDFRAVHDRVFIGTASDRYAGWLGQIYSPGRYEGRIIGRTRHLGGRTYEERILPVDSVEEYFEHFSVLEIDFTFYRPLLDPGGRPTDTYRVLDAYCGHLRERDRVLLKAPQSITAPQLFRGKEFTENPDYLDPGIFRRRFFEPAVGLLGSRLSGIVFEQPYRRAADRDTPAELAGKLRRFFRAIPEDDRYHLELRTEASLEGPVFDVLDECGAGIVLSHWTWLPRLMTQHEKAGGRILNAGGMMVIRLLTPRRMRYEDSYAKAFPFDRMVDGMMSHAMIEDTAGVMKDAIRQGCTVTVIVNNRAGGNAPLMAREIVKAFQKEQRARPVAGNSSPS